MLSYIRALLYIHVSSRTNVQSLGDHRGEEGLAGYASLCYDHSVLLAFGVEKNDRFAELV